MVVHFPAAARCVMVGRSEAGRAGRRSRRTALDGSDGTIPPSAWQSASMTSTRGAARTVQGWGQGGGWTPRRTVPAAAETLGSRASAGVGPDAHRHAGLCERCCSRASSPESVRGSPSRAPFRPICARQSPITSATRFERSQTRPALTELSEDQPDPSASPLDRAIGREGVERYEAALGRLRPSDREAIIARFELQQSYTKRSRSRWAKRVRPRPA